MLDMTHASVAGAMIGLAFGALEYFFVMMIIRRFVSREIGVARRGNEALPGIGSLPESMRKVQIILIVAAVTFYPILGYVVGNLIAS